MKKATSLTVSFLVGVLAIAQTVKPLAGYNVIVVRKIEVGSLAANSGFPTGYDGILQKTTYSKLVSSKLFPTVIDGTEAPPATTATAPQPGSEKKILLTGTIIGYDKGSRTARWMVGMGAGKSRVKVRFVATDADTGRELWRTDEEGTFAGTFEIGGGSESKAANESTRKVAEHLVKQMALVR